MTRSRRVHRSGTRLFSLLMLVVGGALLVEAIAGAGGGVVTRLLLGCLFLAAGAGRLYLLARRDGPPREETR